MSADHNNRKHAALSPSKLGAIAVCPQFEQDETQPVHPVTLDGTAIHEAIETRNPMRLPENLRGMASLGIQYWDKMRKRGFSKELLEPRLNIPWLDYGHADLILVSKDGTQADLVDWKTGYNFQAAAETNIQQAAYRAAVFHAFPLVQQVTVHLVYLRLQEVDKMTFHRDTLAQTELELVALQKQRDQAVKSGTGHTPDASVCVYCLKAGVCPALSQLVAPIATAYAQSRPEDLVIPDAYDPALIADPSTMGRALKVAEIMEKWSGSVRYHALQLRLNGEAEIPGTTLAHRRGTRTIVNPVEASKVAEKHGLDPLEILECVEMSASKLEEKIKEKTGKGKKQLAADALMDDLKEQDIMTEGRETFYLRKQK